MLKLIVGLKGSGKTKTLIGLVNAAIEQTNGAVVCIEKGKKLIHEISHRVRLVDTEEYLVDDAATLYGLVAGAYASNHDITDLFIDSALKICKDDVAAFTDFVNRVAAFCEKVGVKVIMTVSCKVEDLPAALNTYLA